MIPALLLIAAQPNLPNIDTYTGVWQDLKGYPSLDALIQGPPALSPDFENYWTNYLQTHGVHLTNLLKHGSALDAHPRPLIYVAEEEFDGQYIFTVEVMRPHDTIRAIAGLIRPLWERGLTATTRKRRDELVDTYLQAFVDDWRKAHRNANPAKTF